LLRRARSTVELSGASFTPKLNIPSVTQQGEPVGPSLDDPVIRASRLLRRLSALELSEVLGCAAHRRYPADTVIIEQDTSADRLFLLLKGSARHFFLTPDGRKAYLLWLTPGDAFGAASLLAEPGDFLVSTEIISESWVLIWRREAIREFAVRHPILLENGLSIACDYLIWYVATHLSLICDSARQRLAHVLLSLARGIGRKRSNGISLEITNEQLASTAHLTHFTVSRLLSEWQRNGALSKSRGRILLSRPEELFRESQESKDEKSLGRI
jgi:CRP-like cAMP-binding protein